MHEEESQKGLGAIKIHKNVISSIASLAASEIEGVKRIGGDLKSGLLELIGKRASNITIKVDIDKNGEVKLDIPLVIKFGFNVADISSSVQESVHSALEKMTNLSIKSINISVQGIERG